MKMEEEFLVKEIQKIEDHAEEIVKEARQKAKEREALAKKEIDTIALEYEREHDHQVERVKRRLETQRCEEEGRFKAQVEADLERLHRLDEEALDRMVERVVKRVQEG